MLRVLCASLFKTYHLACPMKCIRTPGKTYQTQMVETCKVERETDEWEASGRQAENQNQVHAKVGDKWETSGRQAANHATNSTQSGRQAENHATRVPRVGDKWETSRKSCHQEHPEWETSDATKRTQNWRQVGARSTRQGECKPGECKPGDRQAQNQASKASNPFQRSKNPIQVNLFGENHGQ